MCLGFLETKLSRNERELGHFLAGFLSKRGLITGIEQMQKGQKPFILR
jgi:hypothetical protein